MKFIFPVSVIIFLFVFLQAQAQKPKPVSETSVYLSTDKDIYIAGESLLFNAFILEAETRLMTGQDNILYLQMVNTATDSTVWKEMYPIEEIISYGRVNLAPTLPAGKYLLRAFTAHSFFRRQQELYAVTPIQIVKNASAIKNNGQPAEETPFAIDKKLTVRITTSKETYTTRDKVTLKITTTDETGTPKAAYVSLKVYDRLFNNPAFDHDIVRFFHDKRAKSTDKQLFLSDSIYGQIVGKKVGKQALMLFNYNRSSVDFVNTDDKGKFALGSKAFRIGHRYFIKDFTESDQTIRIADPFDSILAMHFKDKYREKTLLKANSTPFTNRLQYDNLLQEVVVKSKGKQYGDPYFGYLDSIAKFEGNTDYVGECGWLNCPACGHGTKPVEGITYSELKPEKKIVANSHPFPFGANDYVQQPYHYPKYTEAELLKKFKMAVTRGFYPQITFIDYNYKNDDKQVPDTRNVLYWDPGLMTNTKGEVTVTFYTSDIQSSFISIAESVSTSGYVGSGTTEFFVQ